MGDTDTVYGLRKLREESLLSTVHAKRAVGIILWTGRIRKKLFYIGGLQRLCEGVTKAKGRPPWTASYIPLRIIGTR